MWFWQLTQRVTAEPHKEVSTIWAATNGKLGSIQTLKRYKNGNPVPVKYGVSDPIQIANQKWSGSNAIWLSPMWRVLKAEPIDEETFVTGITALGRAIGFILLSGNIRNFPSIRDPRNGLDNLFRLLQGFPDFRMLASHNSFAWVG